MAINFAAPQCQQQEQETLNEKKYSLTLKEISLIIDKVKAKTLFDLNFSASQVRERLLNKKHTLKTLYKWKRAHWNVESFIWEIYRKKIKDNNYNEKKNIKICDC